MGLDITVTHDVRRLIDFASESRKQLPFATSLAVNSTTDIIKKAFNKSTNIFRGGATSFTKRAFTAGKKSNKRNLERKAFAIDVPLKDRARYLRFMTQGGSRPQKAYEKMFSFLPNDGTIPSGAFFIPSGRIKLDARGNVSKGNILRIKQAITGEATKSSSGSTARGGGFIGTPRNLSLPPGIYRRSRGQLHPLFYATTDSKDYRKKLDIEKIGQTVVGRHFTKELQQALDKALKTAK